MKVPLFDAETAEQQTLDEILDWNRGIVEALEAQRASVQQAIQTGTVVANRFVGLTEGDIDTYLDAQRLEVDRLTVLNLVASAEATIRIDYRRRVSGKLKDALAKAYGQWHKSLSVKKRHRPDFDVGGILDVLKNAQVMDHPIIGRYRECLKPRHWVGHGRYWNKPVEVDHLDPVEVSHRATELLLAIARVQ